MCNFNVDCTKIPIPSRCVKFCLEKYLRTLNIVEKQLILGLDKELANAIYTAYNSPLGVNSYEDLESQLSEDQNSVLLNKFKNINQFQLNYFRKSEIQRSAIRREIGSLGLDFDNIID